VYTRVGKLPEDKKLVIGGDFKDGERCVVTTRGHCSDIAALKSNREEADTRLFPHVKYVANAETIMVIQSPDTDVLVLGAAHLVYLAARNWGFAQV